MTNIIVLSCVLTFFYTMKKNRIYVNTDYRADGTISYTVAELIFTGEGEGDFKRTVTEKDITSEKFPCTGNEEADDKVITDFFRDKFAKEGFDFDCLID